MAKDKILLGTVRKNHPDDTISGSALYLEKHSWDCEWYWGFGYIGNARLHCHFERLFQCGNEYWPDIDKIFVSPNYTMNTWYKVYDLFKQAYALRKCAEVYRLGGHITSGKDVKIITDKEMENRINQDLEKVLDKVWHILTTEKIIK